MLYVLCFEWENHNADFDTDCDDDSNSPFHDISVGPTLHDHNVTDSGSFLGTFSFTCVSLTAQRHHVCFDIVHVQFYNCLWLTVASRDHCMLIMSGIASAQGGLNIVWYGVDQPVSHRFGQSISS